jgi:hypothetical protein
LLFPKFVLNESDMNIDLNEFIYSFTYNNKSI